MSQQATAFSTLGGRLETENPVLGDVDSLDAVLREPAEGLHASRPHEESEIHLYVCTHSQRNCRCGDMGGKAVVSHLKKEVKERGASAGRVRIGQIRCEHFSFSARRLVRTGKTCPPNLLTVVLAIPRRPLTLSAPTLLKDPLRVGEGGAGCVL